MAQTFAELVIGGVLFAPFVTYLAVALIMILALRPVLHAVGFAKMFSHAAIAEMSLFVTVLGLLILLF
jgi:hypothetical protein